MCFSHSYLVLLHYISEEIIALEKHLQVYHKRHLNTKELERSFVLFHN
jgi:hypothetical protein